MGCGKTTIGHEIADKTGRAFVDLDEHIEKSTGSSITEIFKYFGEAYFRKLETGSLKEICAVRKPRIVAIGGGAIISPENARFIYCHGTSIFIDVDFDTCYERIKDDPSRPLAAKPREELEQLYNQRRPIYLKHAKYTIKEPSEIYAYL
jgi:shikimate kinase